MKKQSKTQELMIEVYEQLRRETDDIPTVEEVQKRFSELYEN